MNDLFTYRVYERDEVRAYRFQGRYKNKHPINLQAHDWRLGWVECPNINISVRIADEEICQDHQWSRWTNEQWHCKKCGITKATL